MIRVLIEMWPGGFEKGKRPLGEIIIANKGGSTEACDYEIRAMKSAEYTTRRGVWKKGIVKNFPRARLGQYDLLLRGLIAICGQRSKDAVKELSDEFGCDERARQAWEYDARVTELLAANNAEVERRRALEARVAELEAQIGGVPLLAPGRAA